MGPRFHFRIPRPAAVLLVMLFAMAWGYRAAGDEIHDAARDGDLAKVKALLQHDPSLVFSKGDNYFGGTPLHLAAGNGHIEVAQLLLDFKAVIDAKNDNGYTPLYMAARSGHKDVVELLLANGADINAKDNKGQTPLGAVLSEVGRHPSPGQEDVAEFLRQHGGQNASTQIQPSRAARNGEGQISGGAEPWDLAKVKALIAADPNQVFSRDKYGQTALHYAAVAGDSDLAELLLANHADVNAKEDHGLTPLHVAAAVGHTRVAELLLANHAEIDAKDSEGETPLARAAQHDSAEVAQLLLANNADVNTRDNRGLTPLHLAAQSGHNASVARLLLARGANTDARDNNGFAPLHYAARSGSVEVAQLLLAKGADVNARGKNGVTPLHATVALGQKAVAALLLANGADVNAADSSTPIQAEGLDFAGPGGSTPLHYAALFGQKDLAELLLKNKADVNAKNSQGHTPLYEAMKHQHTNVADLLRQNGGKAPPAPRDGDVAGLRSPNNGAEPSSGAQAAPSGVNGVEEINSAAKSGDLAKVQELLNSDPKLALSRDRDGYTPLHFAAQAGHREIAELLLANHADINAGNDVKGPTEVAGINLDSVAAVGSGAVVLKDGQTIQIDPIALIGIQAALFRRSAPTARQTPLHLAAKSGQKDMVELLLENHADMAARDIYGHTALHDAAEAGQRDVVQLLLAKGADIEGRDGSGDTALHIAALEGQIDVVKLLLANKADVNARDTTVGDTPLHEAAYGGGGAPASQHAAKRQIVELLLASGADVNARNKRGETPLHVAENYRDLFGRRSKDKDMVDLLKQHGGRN
jgi:ankyrin repeat protein